MSAGYNQPYQQPYDQAAFAGNQDVGMKARLINLIGAVRTLLRSKLVLSSPDTRSHISALSTIDRTKSGHHNV